MDDYEETIEYTPSGKPDYYLSQGVTDDFSDEAETIKVIEISHVYRDDDTLFYREYWHNPNLFGSTLCYLESFYDESERVIYEKGYITHGNLEYYYIYEDEGRTPVYCLIIDDNLGYKIAELVQYY